MEEIPAIYMQYWAILLAICVGVGLTLVILLLSALVKPRRPNPAKSAPFECGIPIIGPTRIHVSVKFYLFALLFLLFDMETMYILAWAIVFKTPDQDFRIFLLIEMGVFTAILLVGYAYAWRKGAFQWS